MIFLLYLYIASIIIIITFPFKLILFFYAASSKSVFAMKSIGLLGCILFYYVKP